MVFIVYFVSRGEGPGAMVLRQSHLGLRYSLYDIPYGGMNQDLNIRAF